jgi:alkylhydroperoxidase family enzyme
MGSTFTSLPAEHHAQRAVNGQQEVYRAVLTEDKKRAAYRALEDRILNGPGTATPDQRARAFSNAGLSQPLAGLVGKVATRPAQVTEADFAAARAAGFSEDQLFELVICAAVGQSARLYDAGLAALAGAIAVQEDG